MRNVINLFCCQALLGLAPWQSEPGRLFSVKGEKPSCAGTTRVLVEQTGAKGAATSFGRQ